MSGLPASGKTTLGQRLGAALDLPVLDKDDYLSALFAEHDDVGPELRSKLSRQADVHLERDARERDAALTISFWRRAELSATSGTPTDWLASLGMLTEVHCRCPPVVAAARFIVRRRDSGHGDAARSEADLVEQFEAQARLGPLGIGRTIVVDTEQTVDVRGLATMLSSG